MWYCNKEYSTMGEVFDLALKLAKENKQEAKMFFESYVKWIKSKNMDKSYEECEQIAKSNLGYFAGYYDKKVCDIIYKTYQCSHPIFGKEPYAVSPEDAYAAGYGLAKK